MTLKQAFYFKTIVETGSITLAARKLFLSQPSLSQTISQMEEEAGIKLFDRSKKPLALTYAGERYLYAARVILNTHEILENELKEIKNEDSGRLRLGISMIRSTNLLPQVLPRFKSLFPKVEVNLIEMGSAHIVKLLREREVDLALASIEATDPMLDYRLIKRETIGILTGKESLLASSRPKGACVDLKDLSSNQFVTLKTGHNVRVIQDYLFQKRGFNPSVLLETDSMATAQMLAVNCDYYMLSTDSYLPEGAYFYPLKGYENHRHFYACTRKNEPIPKYVETFIEIISRI